MKEKQENKKENTRGKNGPGVNVQSTFGFLHSWNFFEL